MNLAKLTFFSTVTVTPYFGVCPVIPAIKSSHIPIATISCFMAFPARTHTQEHWSDGAIPLVQSVADTRWLPSVLADRAPDGSPTTGTQNHANELESRPAPPRARRRSDVYAVKSRPI